MASCEDKKLKLIYFNGRGKAEIIRYVLHFAKAQFEDYRMSMGTDDWPTLKPKMPVGQAPVLEVAHSDGSVRLFCQSSTITRMVASWYGLNGQKPCEQARADEAYEILRDVIEGVSKVVVEKDEAKKEQVVATLNTETIPRNFAYLEKSAKDHDGKNLAGGENFTYADIALASILDSAKRLPFVDYAAIEANYPTLIAIKNAIEETPEIKAYLASRPETPF